MTTKMIQDSDDDSEVGNKIPLRRMKIDNYNAEGAYWLAKFYLSSMFFLFYLI